MLKDKIESRQGMTSNKAECVWSPTPVKGKKTYPFRPFLPWVIQRRNNICIAAFYLSSTRTLPPNRLEDSLFIRGCVQTEVLKKTAALGLVAEFGGGGGGESQILLKLLIRHSVICKPAGGKALCANTSATRVIGQSVCGAADAPTTLLFQTRPCLASLIS